MVYVNLLYKFSFLTISLLDTAKRILYNSCVIRENKAVKSMKAKTVLILLSAVILCLTGCTESQKPTTVVDNSSAVTTSSSADSESVNDKYYDSTPISQAIQQILMINSLKYTTKPFQSLKNLSHLT